ncbi:iron-siderophore ABC transporter substrate-binding protein [Corynebacterium sp.]|uniref:iron-siderophore ABC transporter substrate-binding protein n=1 Tax=Corynebacterium sp. TaxID=1720 RepID=UPI0026DB05E2|nr:iron-siderophore ABC transporter substrate-binding protein [Corynebacterium sp.]MDO5076660.1 iron-siderophore ABC transporter substrate-binding protein [Corynebacterium sp.]
MRRTVRLSLAATAATLLLALPACSTEQPTTASQSSGAASSADSNAQFPITIKHALGETTIKQKPERVATVGWSNHEVPLAFGVVPVGISKVTWGDDNGDGILPWDEERIKELGGETPVLFDETDAIPFEQIADTKPDVILAAYSGLSQEDYDQLSKIAPVVAYPNKPWTTTTSELISLNATGLGMQDKAEEFQQEVDAAVTAAFEKHPNLKGKKVLFSSFGSQNDKSKVGFYTLEDPRAGVLKTIGFGVPKIVEEETPKAENFWVERSAEEPEAFEDVDIIISYGSNDAATNEQTLKELQADPLLSKIPAIRDGHVAFLGEGPVAAAAGGSPAGLIWGADKYFEIVSKAAE